MVPSQISDIPIRLFLETRILQRIKNADFMVILQFVKSVMKTMEYKCYDNGQKRLSHEIKGFNVGQLIRPQFIQSTSFDYAQ